MELSLALPDDWQDFIAAEAAAGGFASPADYVLALVTHELLHRHQPQVDALLREGLASGEPREWTDDTLDTIRRGAAARG